MRQTGAIRTYIGLYWIAHILEEYIRIDRDIERVSVGHGLMGWDRRKEDLYICKERECIAC